MLYFVLQNILTYVKQVVQSGPAFCNCSKAGLDVATCGVANATGFGPLATNFSLLVASLATAILSYYFILFSSSFPKIHDGTNEWMLIVNHEECTDNVISYQFHVQSRLNMRLDLVRWRLTFHFWSPVSPPRFQVIILFYLVFHFLRSMTEWMNEC